MTWPEGADKVWVAAAHVFPGWPDVVADGRGGPAADLFEARQDLAVLQVRDCLPMPGGHRRRQSDLNTLGREIIPLGVWYRVTESDAVELGFAALEERADTLLEVVGLDDVILCECLVRPRFPE